MMLCVLGSIPAGGYSDTALDFGPEPPGWFINQLGDLVDCLRGYSMF
jgi:hypothetical protein